MIRCRQSDRMDLMKRMRRSVGGRRRGEHGYVLLTLLLMVALLIVSRLLDRGYSIANAIAASAFIMGDVRYSLTYVD